MRLLTSHKPCAIARGAFRNTRLIPHISRASVSTLHAKIDSPPPRIVKSQGCWLETHQGHKIIDASSGAAVVSIGHNESRVKDAIAAQLDQVAYCYNPFFTTEAAEKISSFLTKSTNGAMSKVFIVSSGSYPPKLQISVVDVQFQAPRLSRRLSRSHDSTSQSYQHHNHLERISLHVNSLIMGIPLVH
jgi:hypothetical protein